MRIIALILGSAIFFSSCENPELTNRITELDSSLAAMQTALDTLNKEAGKESKTNLDATGIAIVDMQKLLEQYKGYLDASARWEAKYKRLDADLKQKQLEWQRKYELLQKESQFLREDQVKTQYAALQEEYQQLMQKEQEYTQQVAEEEQKLTKDVLEKVNKHLKGYAKENGYKMILFTNVENSIFYAEDQINITEEYIDALNQAYANGFN